MDSFWIIIAIVAIVSLLIGLVKNQQKEEAKNAYDQSLDELKIDPTNADLRQGTLELGRKYSNLTRNGRGVALFDEVALMNDLNASAGGTMAVTEASAARTPTMVSSLERSVEERLMELTNLEQKGYVDTEEFKKRKADILRDL